MIFESRTIDVGQIYPFLMEATSTEGKTDRQNTSLEVDSVKVLHQTTQMPEADLV